MPKKLSAVEVIPDKFWISYDEVGNKNGTLKFDGELYVFLRNDGRIPICYKITEIHELYEFKGKVVSSEFQKHVFGYPVTDITAFNQQEIGNLPCFTKTEKSKVFFAGGYYGIFFDNGGWLDSHCPKLSTLKKYPYIGPFKTESDMNIAIARKKREQE